MDVILTGVVTKLPQEMSFKEKDGTFIVFTVKDEDIGVTEDEKRYGTYIGCKYYNTNLYDKIMSLQIGDAVKIFGNYYPKAYEKTETGEVAISNNVSVMTLSVISRGNKPEENGSSSEQNGVTADDLNAAIESIDEGLPF